MQCLIKNTLIQAFQKRKNLKVVQRYLRMKYHIHVTPDVLVYRQQRVTQTLTLAS